MRNAIGQYNVSANTSARESTCWPALCLLYVCVGVPCRAYGLPSLPDKQTNFLLNNKQQTETQTQKEHKENCA